MTSTSPTVRTGLAWIRRRRDLLLLVLVAIPVAAVWGFIELADEVMEGEAQAIDEWALLALRTPGDVSDPLGPPWLEEMARDLTALGGVAVLGLLIVAVAGYLALRGKHHALVFMLAATVGGLLVSSGLKALFARPRPDLVPHLSHVSTASFPSGHSMMSAVVFLTLGALLARMVRRMALKLYFVGVALALTFLVGVSRVYAGVHYPSDVLAGWAAGLAWAVACWLVAQYLQERGTVESAEDEEPEEHAPEP